MTQPGDKPPYDPDWGPEYDDQPYEPPEPPPKTETREAKPKVVALTPELPWVLGSAFSWPPKPLPYVSKFLALSPTRVTILSAPPGAGKGFLAIGIALHSLPGAPVFGDLGDFAQGAVGWLDYEEGRDAVERRVVRLWKGMEPDAPPLDAFHYLDATANPAWRIMGTQFPAALAAEVRRLQLKLLVVDTLHACAPIEDANKTSAAAPLQALDSLGKATGCAVLVLAHTRKQPKDGSDPNSENVRGTSAYAGVAGSIWEGKKRGGRSGVAWTHTKCSSHGGSEPFNLQWTDQEDGTLLLTAELAREETGAGSDGVARTAATVALQAELLRIIGEHPGASQNAILGLATGQEKGLVRQLAVLEQAGAIRTQKGKRGALGHWLAESNYGPDLRPSQEDE